jgi:hypothetical protein
VFDWGIKVNRLTYDLEDEKMLKEIYCKWNESPVDMGSVVPQYHLFDAVAKTGHRIVLSGDGADELSYFSFTFWWIRFYYHNIHITRFGS